MFENDTKPPRLHQAIEIVISGRPPTPNARRHWRQIQHDNETWKQAAHLCAKQELREWRKRHGLEWRPVMHCDVMVEFSLKDKRTRDLDNLIATIKPLLDGIVAAGVIVDDSIAVIESMKFRAFVNGTTATTFSISEIEL